MRTPRIVAEALRDVPEPVTTIIGVPRHPDAVTLSALVQARAVVARHEGLPPAFLQPAQVDPWRRTMAALAGWEGAILAEPVGTGKTWIALGVALAMRHAITVLGPAALRDQWLRAGRSAGVPLRFHAMEAMSRGHLPPDSPLVVIDEAHRLRNPATRRARLVAPWLVGRRVLMLTATPIVNRRRDLLELLALFTSDDALALDGVDSLRALAAVRVPPPGLARLVIRSGRGTGGPQVCTRRMPTGRQERARARRAVEAVSGLRLSEEPGVRQLLRSVLLDAAASSDAAFHAALRRYHHLLSQSRDGGGLGRAALRRFLGDAPDQLTMWSLLGPLDRSGAPPEEDLTRTTSLLRVAASDTGWVAAVEREIADGRITICFCRHRATAIALARALGSRVAWVIGSHAGSGAHQVARREVLEWFGPGRNAIRGVELLPRTLVATEVLAEGLDLQAASRVVHVDLPWHDTRLQQRDGRVIRIGQAAESVEVVHRGVPRSIEAAFGQGRRVRTKRRVSEHWLTTLEHPRPGALPPPGLWVSVHEGSRQPPSCSVWLAAGARIGHQRLREDHARPRLVGATAPQSRPTGIASRDVAARAVRRALRLPTVPHAGSARLIAQILRAAREASRHRDRERLACLDRLLAVAARPGTRGVTLLLEEIESRGVDGWESRALPTSCPAEPVTVVAVHVHLHPGPPTPLP